MQSNLAIDTDVLSVGTFMMRSPKFPAIMKVQGLQVPEIVATVPTRSQVLALRLGAGLVLRVFVAMIVKDRQHTISSERPAEARKESLAQISIAWGRDPSVPDAGRTLAFS
jgi:hypothetical protein